MPELKDFTPEEITRFEEIRKIIIEYNHAMSKDARPDMPFISIDERMRCKQYFDIVEKTVANSL
jgi:hypothetical protein